MIGRLPKELEVNGILRPIRTDFRDILTILEAFEDPELEDEEKVYVCLHNLYIDFKDIPKADYTDAWKQASFFISGGQEPSDKPNPKVMDWEQDERLLFPAINKVAGFETRAADYIHWWTFMGYYMEINEGIFSQIVSIRTKKAKGKKLEKYELEFWRNNQDICRLKTKMSEKEKQQKNDILAWLDGKQ